MRAQVNSLLALEAQSLGNGTITAAGLGGADEVRFTGRATDDQLNVAAGGPAMRLP